jgi:uncharacterized membrane protein YccC
MPQPQLWLASLRRLQWSRGLRAGLAVAISTLICHHLALPIGWSALGAFECIIVDNGGPYRIRFQTIAVLLIGGGIGAVLASLVATHLAATLIVTAIFCFVFTYLRTAGDPFTSSSVIVLVIYFVGLDYPAASLPIAAMQALLFLAGGVGAALLCLFLWPIFPFKPARNAIAQAYTVLAGLLAATAQIPGEDSTRRIHELQNTMRRSLENARHALGNVRARAPSRTIRGQSLAVLLEIAELLFGRAIAFHGALDSETTHTAANQLAWMQHTATFLATALSRQWSAGAIRSESASLLQQPDPALQEWREIFSSALNAAASSSSGVDPHIFAGANYLAKPETDFHPSLNAKIELLQQNWTYQSSAFRHALRSAVVCAASVLLARLLHVSHSAWLSLTAVIVLQPWVAHTWRKSLQRVSGTIAGGILAALLTAIAHGQLEIIAAVSCTSFFTLAFYAIDYAWYCFFLTPTFVLLANTGHHSWNIAADRALDTILGAALALLASRLLFTQSEHLELRRAFARVFTLQADYLSRLEKYWATPPNEKARAEKLLLIPGRRALGLANNEAEESLDRLALEFARNARDATILEHALAFTTYSRRLAQTITLLAAHEPESSSSLASLRTRLTHLSATLNHASSDPSSNCQPDRSAGPPAHALVCWGGSAAQWRDLHLPLSATPSRQIIDRMQNQVAILERSALAVFTA